MTGRGTLGCIGAVVVASHSYVVGQRRWAAEQRVATEALEMIVFKTYSGSAR